MTSLDTRQPANLFDGLALGHARAQDAAQHADRVHGGWQDHAWALFLDYRHSGGVIEFQSEDFRAYAVRRGLPIPPDNRSFGAVILRAKKAGLIQHLRYESVRDPRQHGCPRSVWGFVERTR